MSFLHNILAANYRPLQIFNALRGKVRAIPPSSLRVLMYHDIPPAQQEWFFRQIQWLRKRWRFVRPDQFEAMMEDRESIRGRNLLLTFDDGFKSNRRIADEILNPMGLKAIFFIPTDFVGLVVNNAEHTQIARRFYPSRKMTDMPKSLAFMDWSDLSALVKAGHSIGAHTRTHTMLSGLRDASELRSEILGSGETIESQLSIQIRHLALPFGRINSISADALKIARSRYAFIHTGIRGDNAAKWSSWAISRDPIPDGCSKSFVGALLEGATDFLYARSLRPGFPETANENYIS